MEFQAAPGMFEGRVAVLATMHGKERAIAPRLQAETGLTVIVPENFDTDRCGTFTRDIERSGTQVEAARRKALEAMELTGQEIGLASEGSFYPHPDFPPVTCNREIVLLIDRSTDLEIVGQALSTDTNHAGGPVATVAEALSFAEKVGFPAHALVVMADPYRPGAGEIVKGIADRRELVAVVEKTLERYGGARVETDMRALYNPTRMKAIALVTDNLVRKLKRPCPRCSRPGFDTIELRAGLPCGICNSPTHLTRVEILGCRHCGYRQENLFPEGIERAEPMYCQYCNP